MARSVEASPADVVVVGDGEVPSDVLERAAQMTTAYAQQLVPATDRYLEFLRTGTTVPPGPVDGAANGAANGAAAPIAELGGPISPVCPFYVAFDIVAIGPEQLFGAPPFQAVPPHKIIGSGEHGTLGTGRVVGLGALVKGLRSAA